MLPLYDNGNKSPFYGTSLETIELPDMFTGFPPGATNAWNNGRGKFRGLDMLKHITIPNLMTMVCYGDFWGCKSLENVTIKSSITMIGGNAFNGCSSLKNIIIPSSTYSIDTDAFNGCSAMSYILVYNENPPALGSTVFQGTNCFIYIPDESIEAYKSATNWNAYSDRFKPLSEFVEK